MKTAKSPFLRIPATAAMLTVICCVPPLLAADKTLTAPAATSELKPAGYDLEIVEGKLLRNGSKVEATLANVVDSLRDRYTEANIVISPALANLKVTDLKLRAGRLADELEGLRVATGGKFSVDGPSGPNPPMDPNTGMPLASGLKFNAGLFILREPPTTARTERVVAAINIGPYLNWQRALTPDSDKKPPQQEEMLRDIEDMIAETIATLKQEQSEAVEQPTLRFHKGASLLVIIGPREAVETARKIVNALPGMSSVAENSRAQYGLEPEPAQATKEEKARDAFLKRYGIRPGMPGVHYGQPEGAPSEPSPPK